MHGMMEFVKVKPFMLMIKNDLLPLKIILEWLYMYIYMFHC